MKYVIFSVHRKLYFVAIHGFTPMFSDKAKAQPFDSEAKADAYAMEELFTHRSAFRIEPA